MVFDTGMSRLAVVLCLLSAPWLLHAAEAPVRVACLGDSITAGARVDAATESYPAVLQDRLGEGYVVRNFGIGSATLLRSGRPSVWQCLDEVEEFSPEVVIVSLGTNDTVGGRRRNWENIGDFEKDYAALIDRLASFSSGPRILVATPTAMVLETPGLSPDRRASLEERKPRLEELCRRIRVIAKHHAGRNVELLELHPVLEGRPGLVTERDGVHPNAAGYRAMAETVARAIRPEAPQRPNIVFFFVDDMGWQDTSVPFHGEPTPFNRRYRTPQMERLAAGGVKFTQAYACSVCSPSRVSLMTGMNAARHRVTNWTLRKDATNDRRHARLSFPDWNVNGLSPVAGIERAVHARPLPEILRGAGYRTIHAGKAHFGAIGTPGEDPRNLGFDVNIGGHAAGGPGSFLGTQNFSAQWRGGDRVWDVPGLESYHGKEIFLTEALTIEALAAVDGAVADGEPFFLYLSHYAVHVPFAEDSRFYRAYRDRGLDHTEAMYAAMVEGMDKSLGDVLDRLDHHGIADSTVVFFFSDNGGLSAHGRGGEPHTHNLPLSSGKGSAHEGGVRVPLLVRWPGVTVPGSACETPVIVEDLFPTLLEIARVDPPEAQPSGPIDGRSFTRLLRGDSDPGWSERPLVWHFPNNWGPRGPGIGPSSAIRMGDWKLIHYYDPGRPTELFDLGEDIGETRNLAEEKPEIRARLLGSLAHYLAEAGAQFPIDRESGEVLSLAP